jgi:hypothetical protein
MKGPVFHRGSGVDRAPEFLDPELLLDGNRLRLVGLITPDIPLTGLMLE